MRSKLFVPATRPEFFAKALAGQADSICIDLEDAVVEARKAEARDHTQAWLQENAQQNRRQLLMVRINAMDTPHFEADLQAVVWSGLDIINLPKPADAAAVQSLARMLDALEAQRNVPKPVQLLLNIETPRALRLASELALAHPRVTGLQLGLADLFEPYVIDRSYRSAVEQVQLAVRLAAAEAGVLAFDAAYANVNDAAGFEAEALIAKRLGYAGKTCIHPSQIELANKVFQPNAADIASAQAIVSAWGDFEAKGTGAFMLDGKMIDRPFVLKAQQVVQDARRYGLL